MFFGSKKLSLIDYLYNSSNDEIVEIDIFNDTFKQIYHTEGKYFIPRLESSFVNLFDFALQGIVHPDDIEIFNKLMDPRDILDRLHNNKDTPNFLVDHFRYRLQNGNWRWVEQCVVSGKENNVDEGKIVVFIRDIENQKIREKGLLKLREDFNYSVGKDELTRLDRSDYFFDNAEKRIKDNPNLNWCLLLIDIENFKLFDEWHGRKTGDMLLAKIGNYILSLQDNYNCLGGYFGQDDFSILLPYDKKLIDSIYDKIQSLTREYGKSAGFAPAFGIYIFEKGIDITNAYDFASIATARAKKDIKNRIFVYDGSVKDLEENEYKILSEAIEAIQNDEITFFLQPQCRISTKKIVGAESLARWIKPNGTIIPPLHYIPILEKYGFISDLDKVLWEKVFKWLRNWLDKGKKAVPISLNVSRSDIFALDVLDYFIKLSDKYKIPHNLIKVEITESSYAETTEKVGDLVKKLRENGFTVLMDDFGSGYSSLNVLRTLRVDAIKLDALFLSFKNEDEKGLHILESVVNMTKQLSLPIIVEGVEEEKQVKFLTGLGCRYIQGYYFYKPMPIIEFEKLIDDGTIIDEAGIQFKSNQQFRVQEFLDKNVYSDTMLNSILGPVAIYSWKDNNVDIIRYNEQFYKAVSTDDFNNRLSGIQNVMPPADRPLLFAALKEAVDNKLNGSIETMRFYKADGTLTSFIVHFFYLGERDGAKTFYGSATNITYLADLKEAVNLIADYSNDGIILIRRFDEILKFEVISHTLSDLLGISRVELEKEMNDETFVNRLKNKNDFLEFLDNLPLHYQNDLVFSFIARLNDKNNKEVEVRFELTCVSSKTNNVKYILRTILIK